MKKNLDELTQGEIFFAQLNDVQGHEQDGNRPFMVISEKSFNEANGYVIVMPLSNKGADMNAIAVTTKLSKVKGFVLTQHLSPYYPKDSKNVKIVDTATVSTLEATFKMYTAITTVTDYTYDKGFMQGEIVELTINGSRANAVVLSENSFNELHNSIWVAPLLAASEHNLGGNYVYLDTLSKEKKSVYYVLTHHLKNVSIDGRGIRKTGKNLSINELKSCNKALKTFI